MDIGLDFDGVIGDSASLKLKYLKKLFGLDMELKDCTRKSLVKKGISNKQYDQLLSHIYDTDIAYEIKEIKGAMDAIKKLKKEGHHLKIVTSRFDKSGKVVKEWLRDRKIKIPVICTSTTPKGPYCRSLDVFVDDEFEKLKMVRSTVDNLFLFSAPYNKKEKIDRDITRVKDWKELYKEIQKLKIGYDNLS